MLKNPVTVDGNGAASAVAYAFSEIAAIYPITPSSPMAAATDRWSANGRKNMFGQTVRLVEMQSEAGAIGAVHGALQAGSLATTFTSSQGLMLMIPTLYRIAGEHLPAVLHVAARTVGTHAMSIFGDHSDVMACRGTGLAMLCSGSVQEAADLAACAHLSAVKGKTPFMHFFDGFRTSHELSRIDMPEEDKLTALMDEDALNAFRDHALNPEHPLLRSTVQNGDIFFQNREASNPFYDALPGIVEDYMAKIGEVTGRTYHPFDYYGANDAERVIIAMGSVSGTVMETVDALQAKGEKVGFIQVRLYRPFSTKHLLAILPAACKKIAVLDRCKEPGAAGEPLYQDVCAALHAAGREALIVGGRYGLSGKDTDPAQINAAFENLKAAEPKNGFTLGIEDDVTHLSLKSVPIGGAGNADTVSCKFWGLGGDGTVGANHNTLKILGEYGNYYAQAYFEYDAKKSFGVTKSHLRFSASPIRGSYYVKSADFVACHNQSYITRYDIASEVRPGGILLVNCTWKGEELSRNLPAAAKRIIANNGIRLFTIDATEIAGRLGLGSHTNTVLQAAFFALSGMMPVEAALERMKDAARKTYFAKGPEVVEKNVKAIDAGAAGVVEVSVPEDWKTASDAPAAEEDLPAVVKDLLIPVNAQKGDDLPVSAFAGREDGTIEPGLTAFEKRGIAVKIPAWDANKCLQCNRCAFVCPHAAIRPFLLNEEEKENAPEGFLSVPAKGTKEPLSYTMQISAFDCTGCGSCASVCPAKEKALTMVPAALCEEQKTLWNYALALTDKGDVFKPDSVKGSQFRTPLVEFSAACAGCGETPYAKLLTQLFGTRAYWANATGCSQAWGSPVPGIPYAVDKRGFGPAWTNSLFENNAELALGLCLSAKQQRLGIKTKVEELMASTASDHVKAACRSWLDAFDDFDASRTASDALLAAIRTEESPAAKAIRARADQLARKTFWMFGGDGWAYDIGFGGLDHVIASGEDINVLVVDTEVYSNTGGQSSKATQIGAVAQFASAGKKSRKKDLGAIMMTYGNVYVAQVAMGANPEQLVKALKEAESFPGPSVVIAYAPCSAHGIKAGMGSVQQEMKRAVDSGYWILYRYDPRREKPLQLDSPAPTMDYESFLEGENRFASLRLSFPENAEELFKAGAENAKKQYARYRRMEENN